MVARINGYCLGAGLEVAACCDIRLASLDALFGMPEVLIGIPSVIEAAILPRLIGLGRAKDLVMTGRTIDAHCAAEWGLIDRPVAIEALDDLVTERVNQLLSADAQALTLQKRLALQWEELPLSAAIEAGIDAFSEAYKTDEPNRRMHAFLDRKKS